MVGTIERVSAAAALGAGARKAKTCAASKGRAAKVAGAMLCALLAVGCASTGEEVAPDVRAGGGGAGSPLEQRSAEYFRVSVGDRIFFATDSSNLTPSARTVLQRQAQWLKENGSVAVRIEGHADERGTREYNLALGARRADAVVTFLASQGVDRRRLEPVSFGKERPVATCSRADCWSRNRRSVTVPR